MLEANVPPVTFRVCASTVPVLAKIPPALVRVVA